MQYFNHVLHFEAESPEEARSLLAFEVAKLESQYTRPNRKTTVESHLPINCKKSVGQLVATVIIRRYTEGDLAYFIYYQLIVDITSTSPVKFPWDEEEESVIDVASDPSVPVHEDEEEAN